MSNQNVVLDPMDFYGEGLKRRREEAGISVERMAEFVGVGRNTISRYESGARKPSLRDGIRMYNFINMTLEKG